MRWWQKYKHAFGLGIHIPEIWQNRQWQNAPLLAVDLELTSLDTDVADITSIGWVSGCNGQIDLQSGFYQVINTAADLQQSPVIHGLTAEHIAQGGPLEPALRALASLMHNHILIFHFAPLDMKILSREMAKLGVEFVDMLSLDTLSLEKYILHRGQASYQRGSLVLADCRRRYQLPPAPEHNALDDAMATLELAFAQLQALKVFPHQIADLKHTNSLTCWS